MNTRKDGSHEGESELQQALDQVANAPPNEEAEIAADDIGATALAETSRKDGRKPPPSAR